MIKTGCFLDNIISNYKNEISCIYGKPATGKTTIAKLACIEAAKTGKVIFIDSENGFSIERFKQLTKDYKELLDNILILKPKSYEEQIKFIQNLGKAKNLNLIVLDTVGVYYRLEARRDVIDANRKLNLQMKVLSEMTRKNIPVLLLNQVYTNIDTNKVNLVGGEMMRNWSSLLIKLEKEPRRLIIEKPFVKEQEFEIGKEGIHS